MNTGKSYFIMQYIQRYFDNTQGKKILFVTTKKTTNIELSSVLRNTLDDQKYKIFDYLDDQISNEVDFTIIIQKMILRFPHITKL